MALGDGRERMPMSSFAKANYLKVQPSPEPYRKERDEK